MSSSPDVRTLEILLRGEDAQRAAPARLDTELRTSRYVRDARSDARLVDPGLERAFDEVADEVRRSARAEGYAVGWAAGRAAGERQVRQEAADAEARRAMAEQGRADAASSAVGALHRAATKLEESTVQTCTEARELLLDAALQIAASILSREVRMDDDALAPVRRALDLSPSGRPVVVHLHPEDALIAREMLASDAGSLSGREVLVVDDPSLEPGDCVARCDATRVDARLADALARAREVLLR